MSKTKSLLNLPWSFLIQIAESLDSKDTLSFALTNSKCNLVIKDLVASPFIYVLNSRFQGGFPSLMSLALLQRKDLIIKLLDRGVDVNVRDEKWGETVLHSVSTNGLIGMAAFLIEKGASLRNLSHCGNMPIHFAAQSGHADIVDMFLHMDRGLINAMGFMDATPLHSAAHTGHRVVVELLLRRGALSKLDCYQRTPLVVAASFGNIDVVSSLLNFKAFHHHVDQPGTDGYTALHWAACTGREDIALALIKSKGYLVIGNEGISETALHTAAKKGNCGVIKVLIEGNFGVDLPRRDGYSPLHLAARKNHVAACRLLLTYGANPNIPRPDGYMAIHCAAYWRNWEVFNALLDGGADINLIGGVLTTVFHLVAGQCDSKEEDIKYLLAKGARYHHLARDANGNTVLHCAAASGSEEVVKFLLTGANKFDIRNVNGFTPLELARVSGHTRGAVISLLRAAEKSIGFWNY